MNATAIIVVLHDTTVQRSCCFRPRVGEIYAVDSMSGQLMHQRHRNRLGSLRRLPLKTSMLAMVFWKALGLLVVAVPFEFVRFVC